MTDVSLQEVEENVERVIVHQFDPDDVRPGGVETCISDLIAYAPDGVTFGIVGATSGRTALGRWRLAAHRGRDLFYLPVARLGRDDNRRLPHSLRLAGGLARTRRLLPSRPLQAHRIDVGEALATVARRVPRVQFIHNPHGRAAGVLGAGSDSYWRFFPAGYRALERRSLQRPARIVVFSRAEAARLEALGHAASAWQTWYDPAVFWPGSDPRPTDGAARIAWIGRLEHQKDPLLALETLKELRARGVDATLTFLGAGSLGGAVRREIASNSLTETATIRPRGERQAVAELLRNSDVLLSTSHYEGSPRVVIEALATGTPVLATAQADPDRLIDGRNGRRVTSRDPRELAAALVEALSATREACTESVRHLAGDTAVPRLIAETSER